MKYFKRVLTLLLCVALTLGIAACEGGKSVTLVDFEDQTVTVEAGAVYTVENPTVKDTEGNAYRATYAVAASNGGAVTVVDNKFNVTSMEGYVVTFVVTAEEKEYTRKITVKVTDTTGPQITVEEPAVGTVDVPYTLPSIRVYDAADGAVKPDVKVFFGETEQTVASDNTFTPKSVGEYTLTVNAKDSRGNSAASVTKKFYVMPKSEKNELTAFSFGAAELTNVARSSFNNIGSASGWEAEFEGRTGVAWQTAGEMAGGAKYSYSLSFDQTAEQLAALFEEYGGESDYFAMDLYVDTDDEFPLLLHSGTYSVAGDAAGANLVKGKTWTRVYMPVSVLLEQMPAWGYQGDYMNQYTPAEFFATQTVLKSNPYGAYFFDMLEKDYKIYFDKIAFYHRMDITLTVEPEQVAHGGTGAFEYTLGGADSQNATLVVTDPDGNIIAAQDATATGGKIKPDKMGTYTFVYTAANGCDFIVKKAECVSPYSIHAEQVADTHVGAKITLPEGTLFDNNAGSAVEATVNTEIARGDQPVAIEGNTILAKKAGEYTITYTAQYQNETFTLSDTFTVFGDTFVISDFNDAANQATELNPQIGIRGGQAGYAAEPVGGREGVAWMTQSGAAQGNTFSLGYSCAFEDIARYLDAGVNAYFTLWVYVDAEGQFEFVQYDDYFSVADETGVLYGQRFVQGKSWTKIYISGEALFGNVAWVAGGASSLTDMICGQLKGGVGVKLFNVAGEGYAADTKIYIDEFAVEAPCYVTLQTDKTEYTVGETAHLQITDALQQGYSIQVKTPASETFAKVTGTSFELTAGAGNYQFVLTVPGTSYAVAVTVSALPLPGTYTIKAENAETSVGSMFTIPAAGLFDEEDVKVEDAAVTVESVKFGSEDAEYSGETLLIKQAGEYTINYICEYAYQTIRGSAKVSALADKLVVSDFNDAAKQPTELQPQIGIRGGQAGYATASVGGREGVAWMTQGGGTFALGFSCELSDVAKYVNAGVDDYVSLWVYVDAEGQFEFAQSEGAFSVADENGAVYGTRMVAGKTWTKIYIGTQELEKSSAWITGVPGIAMSDMFTGQMGAGVGLKLFSVVGLGTETKVYFDDLAIEKASPVTMQADKESYTVGDTLTLQIGNPLARDYLVKMRIPAGEEFVALESEAIVLEHAGDYQFILTMPGRVDQIVLTVSVNAAT